MREHPPIISVQVLQELYVNIIKKDVDESEALRVVEDYLQWDVVNNTPALLLDAISEKKRWNISFWDGMIIAAAKKGKASVILSEDLSSGQDYGGVCVRNPFES